MVSPLTLPGKHGNHSFHIITINRICMITFNWKWFQEMNYMSKYRQSRCNARCLANMYCRRQLRKLSVELNDGKCHGVQLWWYMSEAMRRRYEANYNRTHITTYIAMCISCFARKTHVQRSARRFGCIWRIAERFGCQDVRGAKDGQLKQERDACRKVHNISFEEAVFPQTASKAIRGENSIPKLSCLCCGTKYKPNQNKNESNESCLELTMINWFYLETYSYS